MNKDHEIRIKEKLNFFYREKIKVHVEKYDKEFLNGVLEEKKDEGIYVLIEDKLGKKFIFVSDIYDVSEFREVGE